MSTIANIKGGFLKTLSVSRTANSESICTLNDDFIKKTENYVCQIPRFIMNNASKLSLIDEVMFEIRRRADADDDATLEQFPAYWAPADYQFRPKPYRTWIELARQLERFFHRFGVIAQLIGFPGSAGIVDVLAGDQYPYTNVEVVPLGILSYNDLEAEDDDLDNAEGRHIAFTLDDDGRFSIEFDKWFSSYFYLKVGSQTQIKTGFPEYMFVVIQDNDNVTTHQHGVENLFVAAALDVGDYIFTEEIENLITVKRKFTSTYSLEKFDDRLSIDCVATFPISSHIAAFNNKEEREFILARFAISDYEKNTSEVIISENRLQNINAIKEVLKIGLVDMTRNNPDYTSIYLLPGKIRHVNIKLITRYLSEGKVVRVPTDMQDGTWDLKLLFSKKQT